MMKKKPSRHSVLAAFLCFFLLTSCAITRLEKTDGSDLCHDHDIEIAVLSVYDNTITARITNNRQPDAYTRKGQPFNFSDPFSLQQEINGVWYKIIPLSNVSTAEERSLPAQESVTIICHTDYLGGLKQGGHYRLVIMNYYSEFTVE